MINWDIVRNPFNWLFIGAALAIWLMAISIFNQDHRGIV